MAASKYSQNQFIADKHNTLQYSTLQYNNYNTIHYNKINYNYLRYSALKVVPLCNSSLLLPTVKVLGTFLEDIL
jgi:hypothetical protein